MQCDKYRIPIVLAAVVALVAATGGLGVAKELNPFQGGFSPETTVAELGTIVRLELKLETSREFGRARLTLNLPDGLKLYRGKPDILLADFEPTNPRTLIFEFEVTQAGEQKIWATLEALDLSPGETVRQSYLAVINPTEQTPDYELHTDTSGQKIRVKEVAEKKKVLPPSQDTGCGCAAY